MKKIDSMKNSRPKIKVPLEPMDVIAEIISVSLLVMLIIYTSLKFVDMPDTIPTHFNFKGEADGFGSKNTMWLLPGIGILIYVGFSILNRFPHLHNYMVNITESNALKNYRFSTRVLRFVTVFVMILFFYIQYTIVLHVKNQSALLSNWFIPSIIIATILLPVFLIIYQFKMNKK
ncbi:MAG: DUF1648 domain-containing protein [Gelidibacter sp.]